MGGVIGHNVKIYIAVRIFAQKRGLNSIYAKENEFRGL